MRSRSVTAPPTLPCPHLTSFLCPHCGEPLVEARDGAGCASGHRFDRAREGYLHLLPAGRKGRRPGGDDADMVTARRAFLDAGHYDPVIAAVAAMAGSASPRSVVDAGCGEGSYLAAAVAATGADGWGVDVSRAAVRLAARRHRALHFAVASTYRLPLGDDDVDVALVVFAPRHFPELHRVVRPDGLVVVASPGPDHLAGLRARIYDDPRPHRDRPHTGTGEGDGPPPVQRDRVRFELRLEDPLEVRRLLQMTPYWWSATPDQQAAAGRDPLTTTVDVWVTGHRPPR